MTHVDEIINGYFNWIYDAMCKKRYPESISYRKLFTQLHDTEFIYTMRNDASRADDGLSLRYRFAYFNPEFDDAERYIVGPCSVLEMMYALAIRCEEFMDNTAYGDRTGQWFWSMIVSLGLGSMDDAHYDRDYVDRALERFMYREYEPNGKGGLFTIYDCDSDLRDVEIWWQLCWYLNSTNPS